MLEVIAYILSLAFQIAGAVLLIIKFWGRTQERIIEEYFPGSNIIERDDNDYVTLEKKKVQLCAQKVYDNRMAFIFIALGYILSVFGTTNGVCKCCILLYVILVTTIIILLEKGISTILSRIFYNDKIEMKYDEIKDRADTEMTISELENIFNGQKEQNN